MKEDEKRTFFCHIKKTINKTKSNQKAEITNDSTIMKKSEHIEEEKKILWKEGTDGRDLA